MKLCYHLLTCYFAVAVTDLLLILVVVTFFPWNFALLEFEVGIVVLGLQEGVQKNKCFWYLCIEVSGYYHLFSVSFSVAVSGKLWLEVVTLFPSNLRVLPFHFEIVALELLVGVQYNEQVCYMFHEVSLCYIHFSCYFAVGVSEILVFVECNLFHLHLGLQAWLGIVGLEQVVEGVHHERICCLGDELSTCNNHWVCYLCGLVF